MYYYRLISSMLKAVISTLGTGLYAVYKAESNALASLTTNLYAVYKAESNGNDSLGSYNALSVSGGVSYTTGKSGNAFTFNGTTGVVELPNNSMNFPSSSFSVSFWVYLTNINSANYALVSNFANDGINRGWIVGSLTSGKLYFGIYAPAIQETVTSATISINTWYHVTCVHTLGQPTKTYINGTLDSTSSTSYNPSITTTHYPTIGASKYTSSAIQQYMPNGSKIDEVNFWNRVLTATEVTDLYNSGNGKFYQGNSFYSAVVNDSLGTYNGTAQGGLTYTAGKSGNAFTFNGTTAYVGLPTNTLSSLTDFSISFWYNPSSLPAGSALVGNYTWIGGIDRGYLFYLNYGTLYFRLWGSSTVDLVASGTFSTNTWHHVVLTRKESTRSKIYINGSLNASNTSTVNPNYTTTNYNSLGASQYNATNKEYYCDGKMDEVNIWNKELTSTEVTELYNASTGKFYPY